MRSFPWDSIALAWDKEKGLPIWDRDYVAQDWRDILNTFFSDGVFIDDEAFVVTPSEDGMGVIVAPGKCLINGTIGYEVNNRGLTIQAADNDNDRIDTIVLRWNSNLNARNIDLFVKTGVAQEVAVRPALNRSETIWELGICDILIPRGTSSVGAENITDTRLENERCGVVYPFAEPDTTTFYNQIQAAIDAKIAEIDALANFTYLQGGFYAVHTESDNHLYAYYDEKDNPPPLSLRGGNLYYSVNEENELYLGRVNAMPAGMMMPYAGEVVPDGWLLCDGSQVDREVYSLLFDAIGTTYGDGDGSTTFNLPDMAGRFALGASPSYELGSKGGSSTHRHGVDDLSTQNGSLTAAIGAALGKTNTINYKASAKVPSGEGLYSVYGTSDQKHEKFSHGTQVFGQTADADNMPPYASANYVISTGL